MLRRTTAIALAALMLAGPALAEAALCVCAGGVAALVDVRGNELIAGGTYEEMFAVREGALYAAGSRGDYGLFDAAGERLGDTRFSMIDDGGDALVYRIGERFGAMDERGEPVLAAEWTQLTPDGEGGWLALDGDPLDDLADEIVHLDGDAEPRRTGVYTLSGLARVRCGRMPYMSADGLCGAVDAHGAAVVDAVWRAVGAFENGFAVVSGSEGMGLIDASGQVLLSPVYAWIGRSEAMIAAQSADRVEVFAPDSARQRFSLPGKAMEITLAGRALCIDYGERTCLYDERGAVLAECGPQTTFAAGVGGQFIASDGEWGEACQWLVGPDGTDASGRFQQILPLCEGRYAFLKMNGSAYYSAGLGRVQRSWDYDSMRYGLMDDAGHVIAPAEYLEIRPLSEDLLLLVSQGEVRLADRDGNALKSWVTAESSAPTGEAGA